MLTRSNAAASRRPSVAPASRSVGASALEKRSRRTFPSSFQTDHGVGKACSDDSEGRTIRPTRQSFTRTERSWGSAPGKPKAHARMRTRRGPRVDGPKRREASVPSAQAKVVPSGVDSKPDQPAASAPAVGPSSNSALWAAGRGDGSSPHPVPRRAGRRTEATARPARLRAPPPYLPPGASARTGRRGRGPLRPLPASAPCPAGGAGGPGRPGGTGP